MIKKFNSEFKKSILYKKQYLPIFKLLKKLLKKEQHREFNKQTLIKKMWIVDKIVKKGYLKEYGYNSFNF